MEDEIVLEWIQDIADVVGSTIKTVATIIWNITSLFLKNN
jgi:hypothetical protein